MWITCLQIELTVPQLIVYTYIIFEYIAILFRQAVLDKKIIKFMPFIAIGARLK